MRYIMNAILAVSGLVLFILAVTVDTVQWLEWVGCFLGGFVFAHASWNIFSLFRRERRAQKEAGR